jgi:hypothetical protein
LHTFNFESRYIHRGELTAEFHGAPTVDEYLIQSNGSFKDKRLIINLESILRTPLSPTEVLLAQACLPGKNLFTQFLAQPGTMMLDDA